MSDDSDTQCDRGCSIFVWVFVGLAYFVVAFILSRVICISLGYSQEPNVDPSDGYILPRWIHMIPSGLPLCRLCTGLKRASGDVRFRHHDDFQRLEKSGEEGCWCCKTVSGQFLQSIEDYDLPPFLLDLSHLEVPHLLLWFAEQTRTKTGYLDHFRQIDYFSYIFKTRHRGCEAHPSSQASYGLIRHWLDNCNVRHRCYQGAGLKLPTRLIDVSTEQLYLIESQHLQGSYIALSHCWGKAQPVTTTLSNLRDHLNGISFEHLPKMFQDAVHITRQLKIKYLWIDSLCIIQDSERDWAKEAAKMGNIYRYAFLTIFALDSKDCHQGILVPRLTSNLDVDGRAEECSRIERSRHKMDILKASSLFKRGWVLQERLLSPRILYYRVNEIFWECLTCTARESEIGVKTNQLATYDCERYDCADIKNRLILPPGPSPSLPLSPSLDWHIIVAEYTRCQLTKRTDKLPALSGLASTFHLNTGHTYLAGIWEEDFMNGLLWYVELSEYRKDRCTESAIAYSGPSWSWMSVDCPIIYATTHDGSRCQAQSSQDIKLLDYSVQLHGIHTFGQIVKASATVEAHFQTFWYQHCPDTNRPYIYDMNDDKKEAIFIDRPDDGTTIKKSCGGIWITQRKFKLGDCEVNNPPSFTWSYFLVVVQDTESNDSWRRIGLGRSLRGEELFKDIPKVKIHLV